MVKTKMEDLYDNANQHDPRHIEELPPSVKVYQYCGMEELHRVILLERDRLHCSFPDAQNIRLWTNGGYEERKDDLDMEGTQSDHIIFIVEPSDFTHDFDLAADRSVHYRLSYSPRTRILVIKMPHHVHNQAAEEFNYMLRLALQPMNLDRAISAWGNTTLTDGDGTTKEPDEGWSPRRPPRGAPKRPTVILEVASSETSAKLRRDCHYWVDPARGQATMAIGIKVHAKKPQITIEQWVWNSEHARPIQKPSLTLTKSKGKVRFDPDHPPPQLVIPFSHLFRRPAEGNIEHDIVFKTQELVEFATLVWEKQFDDEQE